VTIEQAGDDRKSSDQRKEALAQAIPMWVARGYRIETQSDHQAVMVKGHRPNNILHLILSLLTAGIWVIVWIGLAAFGGERRHTLSVDEWGNVTQF
jgi:hypothetical protein